jgi:RNA polymerase sigma factor (sigma-70 family)
MVASGSLLSICKEQPLDISQLHTDHAQLVRSIARRIVPEHADDAAHEVWIKLLSLPDQSVENPAAWIRTVAKRTILNFRRGLQLRAMQPIDSEPVQRLPKVDKLQLRVALKSLAPGNRAVLLLSLRGLSHEEIGVKLGIEPTASKVRLSRARATMRALLG